MFVKTKKTMMTEITLNKKIAAKPPAIAMMRVVLFLEDCVGFEVIQCP